MILFQLFGGYLKLFPDMASWLTCSVGTEDDNVAKIDPRLHALFQSLGLNQRTMARLGGLGVTTTQCLHTLCDDRKDLRAFLKGSCGLDPSKGYEHTLEAGKVVSAWEDESLNVTRLAEVHRPSLVGDQL